MFSNQKKSFFKSKVFYGCLIAVIIIFGLWLNYDSTDEESQPTDTQTKVEEKAPKQGQESLILDSRDQDETGMPSDMEDENQGKESEPKVQEVYYLVREIDGVVKVFYSNEAGEEELYQITSIPFALLSNEDQQLFAGGVRLKTEAELESFLENFDS